MNERQALSLTIPIRPGITAYLTNVWTMTEAQWAGMLHLLDAMRPGITVPDGTKTCRRGHVQTLDNTYGKSGRRRCRLCNRENQSRFDLQKYGSRRPHRGDSR